MLEELQKATKAVAELRKVFGNRSVEVSVVDAATYIRVFADTYEEARGFMLALNRNDSFETLIANVHDSQAYISECRAYLDDKTTLRISFNNHPAAVNSWVHGPKRAICDSVVYTDKIR